MGQRSCHMVNGERLVDILGFRGGISRARPPPSVASTSSAMPPKPIRPAIKAATAISLAALRMVGAAPPVSSARRPSASAGKRSGSGASKVSEPTLARSSLAAGPSIRRRPGQAMGDRNAHVGRAEMRHHRAVAVFDHAVDDRLRMHQHGELFGLDREQMMRLDQLQDLVDHGRGIDGDLGTHRPVRMLERLLERGRRASPRASRCGTDRRTR